MCPRRDPTALRVVLRQGQNLLEVGLHQCPSERKGEGGPVRSLHVPSHVPSQPQNAAKVRGFSLSAPRFTAETDWLLEGAGFEPSVPRGHVEDANIRHRRASARRCSRRGPSAKWSPSAPNGANRYRDI